MKEMAARGLMWRRAMPQGLPCFADFRKVEGCHAEKHGKRRRRLFAGSRKLIELFLVRGAFGGILVIVYVGGFPWQYMMN